MRSCATELRPAAELRPAVEMRSHTAEVRPAAEMRRSTTEVSTSASTTHTGPSRWSEAKEGGAHQAE
jgi:hypothetical protein